MRNNNIVQPLPGEEAPLNNFEIVLLRVEKLRKTCEDKEDLLICVKYVAKTSGIPYEHFLEKLRLRG